MFEYSVLNISISTAISKATQWYEATADCLCQEVNDELLELVSISIVQSYTD